MPEIDRLGRLPSPPDPRDHPLSRYVGQLAEVQRELPKIKVPSSRTLPVYDQVGPSCVGNGSALSATIDQRRDHRLTLIYDGEELYARCKAVDGIPNTGGTYPRVGHKLRQDAGILVKRAPTRRGQPHVGQLDKIAAYAALDSVDLIRAAIDLFGAAGLGSTWYAEWDQVGPDGVLEPGATASGGHWYLAIGWDIRGTIRPASLLIQNSWSEAWGRRIGGIGGRCWMPISLIDFADFEAWRTIDLQGD